VRKFFLAFVMICLGMLSIAAWWDRFRGQKEEEKLKAATQTLAPLPNVEARSEEVKQIRNELQNVIQQTSRLQGQIQGNRLEIHEILERAKIHERILQNMTLPKPVVTKRQLDIERILSREKVRLIAEQTQKTQEQLRALEQVRTIHSVPAIPPKESTS